MHRDPRDASLEDELARIRASFLKAASVASAAAVPVATSAGGARAEVSVRQAAAAAAAQPLGAAPPRPQSASARAPASAAEGSRNSELYQVYVGSLKRPKPRKKSGGAGSGPTQHLAVRVPLAASRGGAEADDAGIEEDNGHEEDDMVDDSIDNLLSAKSASASSGRSRRVASAPMTRASLDQSLKEQALPNPAARSAKDLALAFDAGIRAEAAKSIPSDAERRTWSELSWEDRLLLLQRCERAAHSLAAKPSHDVPVPRVLKSRPASASHAQRSSFDWSSRPRPAATQLQRSQPDAAAAAYKPQSSAAAAASNPYLPADCDTSAPRHRPSADSFLARVAAAAERTGGVNDALQLSMMRKRGEGRNVYVTSVLPLCIFVTLCAGT
jgi:hypothetical protein